MAAIIPEWEKAEEKREVAQQKIAESPAISS
jgi:hypothetical protein